MSSTESRKSPESGLFSLRRPLTRLVKPEWEFDAGSRPTTVDTAGTTCADNTEHGRQTVTDVCVVSGPNCVTQTQNRSEISQHETEETHLLVLMWQRFTSVFIKVDIILHLTALRIERVTPLFFFETSFCIRSLYFICNCELVHQQKYLLHICTEPLKLSNYFDYKILICI